MYRNINKESGMISKLNTSAQCAVCSGSGLYLLGHHSTTCKHRGGGGGGWGWEGVGGNVVSHCNRDIVAETCC